MKSQPVRRSCLLLSCLLAAASGCVSQQQGPQGQKQFSSPAQAAQSLVDALRKSDRSRLNQVLGPAGEDILSSGDESADRADAARFLALYDANHRIEPGPGGVHTLIVGDEDWPFPVPIVKSGDGFVFDTATGKEEILNRRIGRNELSAQQVCLAVADAQREYAKLNPMGGDLPQYARKVISDPGAKNGLYWPTGEGQPASPLGPLVATATAEGYGGATTAPSQPRPYHGYFYRLLTSQGPNAPGGTMDYVVKGKLIGGFAVVAYPAQYGNSGIMTFVMSHDGVVYQRDLGPETERLAEAMTAFDPGPEWTRSAEATDSTQTN